MMITIISLALSIFGIILGATISIVLYMKNSNEHWKKKLSKRLKYIQKYRPDGLDQVGDVSGFMLEQFSYWGYYRSGSAHAYGFIIPFISLNTSKRHKGLYVWISIDQNGLEDINDSDLQNVKLIGKGGAHITEEFLHDTERVKSIYIWYDFWYKNAKASKHNNKQLFKEFPNE